MSRPGKGHRREKSDYGMRRTGIIALAGVLVVAALGISLINAFRSDDSGTVGLGDWGIGKAVPPFAVPDVNSDLEGDANVNRDEACSVDVEGAITVCEYRGRPLVISFWFTKGASACVGYQDDFDRVARRFDDRAGFLSVNVRDDRDSVEEIVSERGWQMDLGHDRDGALANLYRVGGCPTFLFVDSEGILRRSEAGETDYGTLTRQVRSFIDGQEVGPKGQQEEQQ
jgi:peroxiredoxin